LIVVSLYLFPVVSTLLLDMATAGTIMPIQKVVDCHLFFYFPLSCLFAVSTWPMLMPLHHNSQLIVGLLFSKIILLLDTVLLLAAVALDYLIVA